MIGFHEGCRSDTGAGMTQISLVLSKPLLPAGLQRVQPFAVDLRTHGQRAEADLQFGCQYGPERP